MTLSKNLAVGLVVLLALFFVESVWAKIYRWIDKNGETQVSTVLPPDAAKYGYEILQNGIVVQRVAPALTKAEIDRNRRREALQKEAKGVVAQATKEDGVTDKTYSSVEEVLKRERARLSELNANRLNNLKLLSQKEDVLLQKQEIAAATERAGRSIPSRLRKELEALLKSIAELEVQNRTLEAQKIAARENFAARKEEVRKRIALTKIEEDYKASAKEDGVKGSKIMMFDAVECKTITECERLWILAREYLEDHSTTPIIQDKLNVVRTANPIRSRDISLTLTRLQREGEESLLFLDVACKNNKRGRRLCDSERIRGIRHNFRGYVTEQ